MNTFPIKDGQYTETIYNMIKESRYEEAVAALSERDEVETEADVGGGGGGSRAALSLLGYCCFRTQRYERAARCYERLAARHPHATEYRLYWAQALHEVGQHEDAHRVAAQAYVTVATAAAAEPELRRRLVKLQAAARHAQGDTAAARALLDSYAPDDPDRDAHAGCLLYADGHYEEALQHFTRGLGALGFDAHLHYNAALCRYRLQEYPQALRHIALLVERGVREHPELAVGDGGGGGGGGGGDGDGDGDDGDGGDGDLKSVGNAQALRDTALTEAFNLKAAVEFRLQAATSAEAAAAAARDALADMPPRRERELDAVTLHNVALAQHDRRPADAFEKLSFLLRQASCPPETFANLLLLYCRHGRPDLAADALADNAQLTYERLSPYLYEFLDALLTCETAPEEAYRKFEELGAQLADTLRRLTRGVQEARARGDTERVKRAVLEYEETLERYVPTVMAQARVHWQREDYAHVERIFRKSVEFCSESDAWRLNVAHVLFMQENKYKEAAGFYEPLVRRRYDDILAVSAVVLANLCVAYIMTSQNEQAEEIMRRVERAEERRAEERPLAKCYHLCIVNLVIGTLYCAKGNYEFGMSRVMKSLEPFDKRLGADTWHYTKRCFLSLLESLAKHLVVVKDGLVRECVAFLDACVAHGRTLHEEEEGGEAEVRARRTIAYEARLLNYALHSLRSIDDSVAIKHFEDLK